METTRYTGLLLQVPADASDEDVAESAKDALDPLRRLRREYEAHLEEGIECAQVVIERRSNDHWPTVTDRDELTFDEFEERYR